MEARHEASEALLAFTDHEHRELVRGIERIHDTACEIGSVPMRDTVLEVSAVLAWYDRELLPHLIWEEGWLYPQIEAAMGTPWATRAARFDHAQVRAMVERLRRDEARAVDHTDHAVVVDLRCRLFSLESLVRAHLEREEQLLLPALLEAAEASIVRTPLPSPVLR